MMWYHIKQFHFLLFTNGFNRVKIDTIFIDWNQRQLRPGLFKDLVCSRVTWISCDHGIAFCKKNLCDKVNGHLYSLGDQDILRTCLNAPGLRKKACKFGSEILRALFRPVHQVFLCEMIASKTSEFPN